jgi:toxin ParE1/3/4
MHGSHRRVKKRQSACYNITRIGATVERLTTHPLIGAPREPLAPGLRSIRVRPFRHLLFYRIDDSEIVLIRHLHSARNLEKQEYEV